MLCGVECGGQSFAVGLAHADRPDVIVERASFATTTPDDTLPKVREWLQARGASLQGVGIACFGPVDLDASSRTYGYITTTPKGKSRTLALRCVAVVVVLLFSVSLFSVVAQR